MQPGRILSIAVVMMSVACVIPAHAETIRVVIKDLVFEPARISAKVGDTVEWVNEDIFAHTATVRGDWDVLIPPKKTVGLVLQKPGDVEYFCRFHPNMTARIAVAPK